MPAPSGPVFQCTEILMDEAAAAGMFVGVIGIIILAFVLLMLIPFIFYLVSLQRCFNAVRPEFRPSVPVGLIWLSLVPAIGFFVLLTAIVLLSTSLKKEDEARGSTVFGDGGLALGLAAVILAFISWIPFIGVLFALASLVCWIMHWVKIAGYRSILVSSIPAAAAFTPPPLPTASPPAPKQPTATPDAPMAPPAPVASAEEATMLFANVGNAKLVCILGVVQGMSFAVGKGVTIGRSPEAEVCVPDPQISNRHAWVGVLNNQLVLRDLKSTNGTYLNDDLNAPVQEQVLRDGDVIVLGKHNQMKFRVTLS